MTGPVEELSCSDLQDEIDAAAAAGGAIIDIPNGIYPGPILRLRPHVKLRGASWNTVIPPVASASPNIAIEGCGLENLSIDGSIAEPNCDGTAIDWRSIKCGVIQYVRAINTDLSLEMMDDADYNTIIGLFGTARKIAFECYRSANSNTFIGGKGQAPLGINIVASNGMLFDGTCLELDATMEFVRCSPDSIGIKMNHVRTETTGHNAFGPVWLNGVDGDW